MRAWHKTYNLPVLILNALDGKELPIYGNGENIRDWLYVEDHVRAIHQVFMNGNYGSTYNIGAKSEMTNNQIIASICDLLQEMRPGSINKPYKSLITYVPDRPGHDIRYALDTSKIIEELAWEASFTFAEGLKKTITWYLENQQWCLDVLQNKYNRERLGLV